jgi:hypothetical protein
MADRIGRLRIDASLKDETKAEHERHLEKLRKRMLNHSNGPISLRVDARLRSRIGHLTAHARRRA